MKRVVAGLLAGVLAVSMLAGCSKQLTPEEQAASEAAVLAQQLQDEEDQTGLKRLISKNITEYEQPFYDFVESLQEGDADKAATALGVPNTFGSNLQNWVIVNNYETFQKNELQHICFNSAKDGAAAVLNVYLKYPGEVTKDTSPDYVMNVDYVDGAWSLTPPTGVVKDYAFTTPTNKVSFEGTDLSSYASKSAETDVWTVTLPRALDFEDGSTYGLAIALIFAFALTFVAAMIFRKNMDLNGAKEIDDRGMITSNAGTYGTAEWMSEAEAKQVYEVGPVEKVTGTILGQFTQEGEEVIALPFEPTGNRNLILIGPPGSGKSFGYVRTAVFQSIVRGESVVVTDPKGEIHNDMRKLLEANGYKVKVFNLINLDLSNAWDCVQEIYDPITGNIDDQRVITFCKTVITNTGGGAGGDPFWESSEENLFRVAVSYCAFMRETTLIKIYERRTKELLTQLPFITEEDGDKLIEIVKNPESAMFDRRKVVEYLAENFYGKEEGNKKLQSWEDDAPTCNISDIYNALLHNDLNSWEDNFKNVPLNHPAASAWAVFKGMGERVQPNIVGGLNTRLQLFMTYKVRRVISNDDIRLANIGAEKTALMLKAQLQPSSLITKKKRTKKENAC